MAGDLFSVGDKRAVNILNILGSFTPGVIYLYFKDPSLYQSLDSVKIILFSISIAVPILILNLSISIAISYITLTVRRYRAVDRLKEEVLNRIAITSGLFSSSIFLNFAFIVLYLLNYTIGLWLIILGLLADILLVILFTCLIKRKVNHDLFYHNFPG
jgi:hypothetical protein